MTKIREGNKKVYGVTECKISSAERSCPETVVDDGRFQVWISHCCWNNSCMVAQLRNADWSSPVEIFSWRAILSNWSTFIPVVANHVCIRLGVRVHSGNWKMRLVAVPVNKCCMRVKQKNKKSHIPIHKHKENIFFFIQSIKR